MEYRDSQTGGVLLAFEEDEHPRGSDGKFALTSDGGSTKVTERGTAPKSTPKTHEYATIMRDKSNTPERAAAKARVVKDLGGRMSISNEKLGAFADTVFAPKGLMPGVVYSAEDAADELTQAWARSSGDGYSMSVATQERAKEVFALDDSPGCVTADTNADARGAVKTIVDEHSPVIDAYLKATYDATQEKLIADGVDELTVYRGMNLDEWPYGESEDDMLKQDGTVKLQPLSSFSLDYDVARDFALGEVRNAVVIAMKVPRAAIFSTPLTGMGCMDELEVVVLGGEHRARVYAVHDTDDLPKTKESFFK